MAVKTVPAVVATTTTKINVIQPQSHAGHRIQKLSTVNSDNANGGTFDVYYCHTDHQVLVLEAA